ncbi:myosin-1-like isoform X2 [Sitophilus oryzae]|uniref:Myosin-1-like isoform X2 n=1 Tax=Sitophilus oryzae TaxID=7048 RepID=A0A6J2XTJ9_SITOR|nr:myosin-1-like isoform X2 [Sitophilus oryzae]
MLQNMGTVHSTPKDDLQYISKNTKALRQSLRNSPQNITKERKESLIKHLADNSTHVSRLHGIKQDKIDTVLNEISDTLKEVLVIEPSDLDSAAIESDSFVHVPISRRNRQSTGSLKSLSPRRTQNINNSSAPSIREIEAKLIDLKNEIKTAINNMDSKQLRMYEKTLKIMASDMESFHVEDDTPLKQRKDAISKNITRLFGKVNKALNEAGKNNNSQNLTKQEVKAKSIQELNNIELQLAESESLLDKMIKDKTTSNFASVRNNVAKANEKLTKVYIVDDEVKEKYRALYQKASETLKTLDNIMSKREFESKLSKAVETLERIVKNFNLDTNTEETRKSLDTLQESVNNITEINESSRRKKRELLSRIAGHISTIDQLSKKSDDSKTIQQIVEENVVLRKKLKSSDKEYTVIDQFINYWSNIRNNFDLNDYSRLSLLRIDEVLDEMQASIHSMRLGIANKCETYPPTKLFTKSQSVPKLDTYRSSTDSSENRIIKTKVRMLNASTPELVQIGKPVETSRFSKIEEVRRNVYYIKEKLDDTQNRHALRRKLEEYLKSMKDYSTDSNKGLANNANVVYKEIMELLYTLQLMEFKERVDETTKKSREFSGSKYEKGFDDIKGEIEELNNSIKTLNIPDHYQYLVQEKDQLLEELSHSVQALDHRPAFYQQQNELEVKEIKDKLQELNDKVKRFSGTYRGVLYNSIERDLNKLLLTIGDTVEDNSTTDQIKNDIERLLKILEQRSSLAQSFRTSKVDGALNEDQVGLNKIKTDLMHIKNDLDRTPDDNILNFIRLHSRLELVSLELGQIPNKANEHVEKEKEILSNEVSTLKVVVDAKITLGQQPVTQWPDRELSVDNVSYPKNDINKEMEKFEKKFQAIKNEIRIPNSDEDVLKYYKLVQDIKKLKDELETYRLIKNTDLYMRKLRLTDEMQYYTSALEKEAKAADDVINLEKKVDNLESLLRTNKEQDMKAMAKELQAIQNKLANHNFNLTSSNFNTRKTSVQQKTEELTQRLKEIENEEQKNKSLDEAEKKIAEIEKKVEALRPEVARFVGVQSDAKFYELDETTMRLVLVLDKLEVENIELRKRKVKLLAELHKFGEILDNKAQQTEELVEIEDLLKKISEEITQVIPNDKKNIETIKKYLKNIKIKLKTLKVDNELSERLNKCVHEYKSLSKTLASLESSKIDYFPRTSSSSASSIDYVTTIGGYASKPYSYVVKKAKQGAHFAGEKMRDITETLVPPKLPNSNPPTLEKGQNRLSKIETELNRLESSYLNPHEDAKLEEMDDLLNRYTTQLNSMIYPKGSAEFMKKQVLFEKIEAISSSIEKRTGDEYKLTQIENELNILGHHITGDLSIEQIDQVDQELIRLQIDLNKIGNKAFKSKFDACMVRLVYYFQNISDMKKSKSLQ